MVALPTHIPSSIIHQHFVEGEDISLIIQEMLNRKMPVYIPRGYYYLDHPILFPYVSGSTLVGANISGLKIGLSTGRLAGNTTRLRYRDINRTGKPCITLQGSEHTLTGFNLLGTTPRTPPLRPHNPIGILQDNTGGSGLGSGKTTCQHVGIFGFTTGLQIGTTPDGHNNDISSWIGMAFENCDNAIGIKNTFAMEHTFNKCQFRLDLKRAFNISGGGHQVIRDCDVLSPMTFLHFNGENPFKYRTGPNNRKYKVEMLKVDSQATRGKDGRQFRLVEATHNNYAWVSFSDLSVGGDYEWSEGVYAANMKFTNVDECYTSKRVHRAVQLFDLPN